MAAVAGAAPGFAAAPPAPTTQNIDFTAPGYTVGDQSPVGQNGWAADTRTPPNYDYGLVDDASFPSSGLSGGVSLRFSNAKTAAGTVIGQLISPYVAAAGETGSGAAYNTFSTSYTIASTTGAYQDGLALEVNIGHSTDRSGGELIFRHVDGGLEIGTIWMPSDATTDDVASWRSARIQGPLPGGLWDPAVPHTIATVTHFVDNRPDQTELTVDGTRAAAIPTWEYYSRLGSAVPKTATNMVFRVPSSAPSADGNGYQTGISTAPTTLGKGFLFSHIVYGSSEITDWTPTTPTTTVSAAPDETALPPARQLAPGAVTATGGTAYTLNLGAAFADQYVALFAYSAPTPLGWFLADGSGVVDFTVPPGLPDGIHTIAAYDATGALVGWIGGVSVVSAAEAADPSPQLAATGSEDGLPFAAGGLLLLLAGAILTAAARRRRRDRLG